MTVGGVIHWDLLSSRPSIFGEANDAGCSTNANLPLAFAYGVRVRALHTSWRAAAVRGGVSVGLTSVALRQFLRFDVLPYDAETVDGVVLVFEGVQNHLAGLEVDQVEGAELVISHEGDFGGWDVDFFEEREHCVAGEVVVSSENEDGILLGLFGVRGVLQNFGVERFDECLFVGQ